MILNCPLCKTNNYSILHKSIPTFKDASIVTCNNCSHIYTLLTHRPHTDRLYNDEVYKVIDNRGSVFDKILDWEYRRVINNINALKISKGSLLDFGSGKGKFASLAEKNGWHVKCVEISAQRAEYAKNMYGLEVDGRHYSAGKIFDVDFDVLALFHVLEHLPDPTNLLKELIKNNLTKDALVIIEVPNIKSLQAWIAGKKWIHLDVPRHISHFTASRLDQFTNELELVCLKTAYFSFHLGVLGMVDSFLKLFGYRGNVIHELKNKKNKYLKPAIAILLPFALLLEAMAAILNRGGIVRKYELRRKM